MDVSTASPGVITTALQLYARGYAVWTRPGISLDADQRARIASSVEGVFLRKPLRGSRYEATATSEDRIEAAYLREGMDFGGAL